MWAPSRRTAPCSPVPVAVNPSMRNMPRSTCRLSAVQGGAGVVAQLRPGAIELAADVGAEQADRAVSPLPVAVNSHEEHVLADPQAVGDQGGTGIVAQLRPRAAEAAADVGAEQADRTVLAVPVAVNPARNML